MLRKIVGGGWLKLKPGEVTDDTQMSLCIARSLVAVGWSPLDIAERFAAWFKGWPVDVGNTCRRGIARYINHGTLAGPFNEGDAGNGAAMRVAPVALWPPWPMAACLNAGRWNRATLRTTILYLMPRAC